jgi:hypothetical protein
MDLTYESGNRVCFFSFLLTVEMSFYSSLQTLDPFIKGAQRYAIFYMAQTAETFLSVSRLFVVE